VTLLWALQPRIRCDCDSDKGPDEKPKKTDINKLAEQVPAIDSRHLLRNVLETQTVIVGCPVIYMQALLVTFVAIVIHLLSCHI